MNMEVQMTSLKSRFQFLWIPTQKGEAGSTHSSIFNFWEICTLFSTVAALICIPTKSVQMFPFLCILAKTCYFLFCFFGNSPKRVIHNFFFLMCLFFHQWQQGVKLQWVVQPTNNYWVHIMFKALCETLGNVHACKGRYLNRSLLSKQ